MNKPTKIILHCAASPDYEPEDPKFDHVTAQVIDKWHRERGFDCIGYHWVVRRSGIVEKGRPESQIGAHCLGQNEASIGICWVGTHKPTPAQINALDAFYRRFQSEKQWGPESWHGHNEFTNKECPGISMEWLRLHFISLETGESVDD
jgi:N-acetylmuramoyl-L-alanine amidase